VKRGLATSPRFVMIALVLPMLLPCFVSAAPMSPLAMSCEGCHRPHAAATPFVALDQLSAATIAADLKRFRDQPDPANIMSRFTKNLPDEQIARLAAELSAAQGAR
jgi:cytochrome c553